jgi:hypothetical protein
LRIEHSVTNFDNWKAAFDSDLVGRKRLGMPRYRILRSIDELNYVVIDLEFDTKGEAEALLSAMQAAWSRVQGSVMLNPQARIVDVIEERAY